MEKLVKSNYAILDLKSSGKGELVYAMKPAEVNRLKDTAVTQTLERTRRRIDKYGVAEPAIYKQEQDQIALQLPGVKNPQEAISFIKTAGRLEFKLVDTDPGDFQKAQQGKAPEGTELLFEEREGESGKISKQPDPGLQPDAPDRRPAEGSQGRHRPVQQTRRIHLLRRQGRRDLRPDHRRRTSASSSPSSSTAWSIRRPASRTGSAAATRRSPATSPMTRRRSSPSCCANPFPRPVKIIQNVTVGPSLGQDSINMGVRSALIGGLVVVIFMVFYYRMAGLIADYAIILNLVLLLGAMALLNATLTLPGIAGIILTIGMGVDSNVLMFERIREEIRAGKPPRPAVDSGYDKAFLTILDSHVTTLITAAVLFMFGTGPIKGFAVSLSLGIIINLYSALVGTKVIFDIINSKWKLEKLSI